MGIFVQIKNDRKPDRLRFVEHTCQQTAVRQQVCLWELIVSSLHIRQ